MKIYQKKFLKKTFEYYYKKTKDKISILTKFNDSNLMFIISNFIDSQKNVKKEDGIKKEKNFQKKKFLIQ